MTWTVALGLGAVGFAMLVYGLGGLVDEHLKTCPICQWEKARFQRRCWRCARG